jgi:cytochrome c oxidase subunit 4
MSDNHGHDQAEGHVVPMSVYLGVFFALLVGTALTTVVAYIDLGPLNTPIALLIAFIKMTLVILFFMHVKYQPGLTRLAILCAFFWLGIMMTLTLTDELTRGWEIRAMPWNVLMPHVTHLARFLF